jgi:UPF0755 protein
MTFKKYFLLIAIILTLATSAAGYYFYSMIFKPNTKIEGYIYIPTNSSIKDVEGLIQPFLKDKNSFKWVATKKNYPNTIKAGKYLISKGINNNDLINLLRSGKQTPIKLSFNNQDTFEKLAGRISKQIEPDSITLLKELRDVDFIKKNGFKMHTALGMYIPNTYEFYWNTSAKAFRNKMLIEYQKFWNTKRLTKAKQLNLSINEIITLASIVQKETANIKERPMVARLYLNRLKDKWPLQADPTIIYALKKELGTETIIKRVLSKDLEIDSPYNTYKNRGLPPGPIAMPDISSINAVLNPAIHDYYYMCASISAIGNHEFSKTLAQHNKNAFKYQQWLNKQGVNR